MKVGTLILAALIGGLAAGAVAQPSKSEVARTASPGPAVRAPVFKTVEAPIVRDGIKIVSGRSRGLLEFNRPLVVVYLPEIDNSAYALVEFKDTEAVDSRRRRIPCERVRGGYDEETFATDIQLSGKNGREVLEFYRVRGTGTIEYPLEISTRIFKKGTGAPGPGVPVFDGPRVTYLDPNRDEMFFLTTRRGPVRAYDASGRPLAREAFKQSVTEKGETRRTLAFSGEIDAIQIDTVKRWVSLEFRYDLPPAQGLAEDLAGRPAMRPARITATPGGKTEVRLAAREQPAQGKTGPKKTPVVSAAQGNNVPFLAAVSIFPPEQVIQLIASGADVNQRDDWGRTPLHMAVYRGNSPEIVKALIAAGAKVNVQSQDGFTPLALAERMKYGEIIALLRKAGAR